MTSNAGYCPRCIEPVGAFHRPWCPVQALRNRREGSRAYAETVSWDDVEKPLDPVPDPPPGARTTDPDTSHKAALGLPRKGSQRGRLLIAYEEVDRSGIDPDEFLGSAPPLLSGTVIDSILDEGRAAEGDALHGLTDEEAGQITSLRRLRACCYWKRCSELRASGLIAPMVYDDAGGTVIRYSSAGEAQRVCRITPAGRALVMSWS